MKKIAIITFHRSHNCGSILQAYATQEVMMQYGVQPEFIDFATQGQKDVYAVLKPLKFYSVKAFSRSVYRNVVGLMLYDRATKNWSSYDKYLTNILNVSKKSYTLNSQIIESEMDYDMYLTGSDQVWNVTIDDYDDAYFLNFVQNHPKIAYAVSQGAKNIKQYAVDSKKIVNYIKDIDFVSTREENGQKWLKELTGNKYQVVLDPTLLHPQDVYTKIEETHKIPGIQKDKFIFVYATPLSSQFMKLIKEYAKQNDLKVVIWHNEIWLRRLGWLFGAKSPKDQNPGKYLDLIKNAKFVCTSSFHGVAFSTIYRKNFVVLENEGMRAGHDDRMTGFLKRVKLSDRIVSLTNFNKKMNESIDYTDFKKELKKQQELSFEFLNGALKAVGK